MLVEAILSKRNKEVKVIDINNPDAKVEGTPKVQSEEKVKRSLAKTISWRIIGTLDTLLLSWLITSEVSTAALIASVEFVSKMILYFFHERAWNKIKWGK